MKGAKSKPKVVFWFLNRHVFFRGNPRIANGRQCSQSSSSKKKRISRILSEHYYIGNKSLSLDSELECDIFYRSLKTIVDRRSQKGLRSFAIIWKHAYAIVCDRDHAIKRGSCDHMETKVLRSKRIP